MAIRDFFKVNRKTFFNPRAWIDYGALKSQTLFIYSILKDVFTQEKPVKEETFEQAQQRFNLSNDDIVRMTTDYHVYAAVLFLLGLVSVGYCFYLLFSHVQWIGCLMGLCVSTLFFAQAFRYDFWAFQLHQRKLGCTFQEWKAYRLSWLKVHHD